MTEQAAAYQNQLKSRNWVLWIAVLLVLMVLILAVFGPSLAPADPMKESYVAELGGRFIRPPFPPGVEGYPLGSDEFGRDVLSRIIWAVRPTMTLVVVVSALRLALGIWIGLLAGWLSGRVGRLLDMLISGALSVPVLFIALCVIAALASRWGVLAFILGLSITGWAESARLVQEQTRALKPQPFIEATHAMGGNGAQIVLGHIIPHVLPLLLIQMAFEVSATLLTTAALGFLGYFINAVWMPVGESEFAGLRASGTPELGQMLGISTRSQPWTALFAGTMVSLVVLAFNLLGAGLRVQLNPERHRRSSEPAQGLKRAGSWLEERLYLAASEWQRTATTGGAFVLLFLVIVGGGWALWRAQNTSIGVTQIQVPGGHMWATELHDAQGTYWSPSRGPFQPKLLWTLTSDTGITGGPVIDRDGSLYLTGSTTLFSVSPQGQPRWQVTLKNPLVGWPALTRDGQVVVSDELSTLNAFDRDGRLLWTYLSDPPDEGRTGPISGPDGTLYYVTRNFIVAVGPTGQREWQIRLPTYSFTSPLPRLSADGKILFFEDTMIDALTGERLFNQTDTMMDKYFTGADGKTYLRLRDRFMEWKPTEKGAVLIPQAKFDANILVGNFRSPYDTGVSPSHQPWLLFLSGFEYIRLIRTDAKGGAMQVTDFPYRQGRLIGIDADGAAYLCGGKQGSEVLECRAVRLDSSMVIWKLELNSKTIPVGGALAEGRLYVSTADGKLFAIGQ